MTKRCINDLFQALMFRKEQGKYFCRKSKEKNPGIGELERVIYRLLLALS